MSDDSNTLKKNFCSHYIALSHS